MSETQPKFFVREEIVSFLRRHKAAALETGDNSTARILGVVTDPNHPRFLEVGLVVNQCWYGEGGLTICYKDRTESFGGEVNRGGVKDPDIGEMKPDLFLPEERRFLKQVCYDPGNLLGEE